MFTDEHRAEREEEASVLGDDDRRVGVDGPRGSAGVQRELLTRHPQLHLVAGDGGGVARLPAGGQRAGGDGGGPTAPDGRARHDDVERERVEVDAWETGVGATAQQPDDGVDDAVDGWPARRQEEGGAMRAAERRRRERQLLFIEAETRHQGQHLQGTLIFSDKNYFLRLHIFSDRFISFLEKLFFLRKIIVSYKNYFFLQKIFFPRKIIFS